MNNFANLYKEMLNEKAPPKMSKPMGDSLSKLNKEHTVLSNLVRKSRENVGTTQGGKGRLTKMIKLVDELGSIIKKIEKARGDGFGGGLM